VAPVEYKLEAPDAHWWEDYCPKFGLRYGRGTCFGEAQIHSYDIQAVKAVGGWGVAGVSSP
jgi:hypothetical protein